MRRLSKAETPPGARRLLRLRLTLTIAFTAAVAVALFVLAIIVVNRDEQLGRERLDARLRASVDRAVTRLTAPDSTAQTSGSYIDAADPFTFFIADGGPDGAAVSGQLLATSFDAAAIARTARERGGDVFVTERTEGDAVRVLARPVDGPNGSRGAVVAALDPGPERDDHRRLASTVWLTCALLTGVIALVGYWLAGRGIKPAADALAQQEQFLADAAHELRTPVAALRAVIDGALAGDEEPRAALARAAPVVARTTGLLDDLLTLARMDARRQQLQREPVRLDLLAEEVLADHPGLRFAGEPSVVRGDAQLLRRLIANLVENAARHGRRFDPAADVLVTVHAGRIVVADRGPGIEPGLQARLFDRFRSGRHSGGAGLGLAIAEWIARAHGGRLTAVNRPEGGAVFTVTLPPSGDERRRASGK